MTAVLCSICLSPFEPNKTGTVALQCGHVYHVECITNWFFQSPASSEKKCPCCKKPWNSNHGFVELYLQFDTSESPSTSTEQQVPKSERPAQTQPLFPDTGLSWASETLETLQCQVESSAMALQNAQENQRVLHSENNRLKSHIKHLEKQIDSHFQQINKHMSRDL